MQTRRGALLACLMLVLALATVAAFNQDRVIYKWSPLWFNNYYRRANLYKRSRDEPIQKWSPTYFSSNSNNVFPDQKKDGSACGRENSLCAFVSEVTDQIRTVRCCGSLQCIYTGPSYTCADPKAPSVNAEEPEVLDY